jgi:hypothetical protein
MSVDTDARTQPVVAGDASPACRMPAEWVDRLLGSDPGLTRLLTALQAVATIGVAMLAEWLFVRRTHALQIDTRGAVLPPAQAGAIAAQHHGVLVIAILLTAIVGMIASFSAPMFATPRARLESFALMPVPMVAGLALGLTLAPYRGLALASFVVVLGVGAYCRRFGPLGFVGGMVLFIGEFVGFFLHGGVHLTDLGWLSAEIVIGVLVAVAAQFTLFDPSRRAALRRMRSSYAARVREVAKAALDLLDEPANAQRASRRLHGRLIRLNEAALMIDAQLGHPGSLPTGWSAVVVHQRRFDSELALTNLSRFAERLPHLQLPAEIRGLAREALAAIGRLDVLRAELAGHELLAWLRRQSTGRELDRDPHIVLHRFAVSVLGFTEAVHGWHAERSVTGSAAASAKADEAFAPAVTQFGGWLPGSTVVSAAASLEAGRPCQDRRRARLRLWDRVRLAPHSRVAIQMSVAVTAALLLGDVVSGRRFYWAVLAAFVTFVGADNAGEQLRKGFFRVAGTVVGVLLGALGAHLVGDRTGVAIAVILGSLFFGLYLVRISYAFLVIDITVMVSQLYVQFDEFTNSLLALRLEETALGAAVAALTVLCVLPLRTERVARVAARHYVQTLADVAEQAARRLTDTGSDLDLRAAIRRLDADHQAVVSTLLPLRIPFANADDSQRERFLQTAAAARHYARNLLSDTATRVELTP